MAGLEGLAAGGAVALAQKVVPEVGQVQEHLQRGGTQTGEEFG